MKAAPTTVAPGESVSLSVTVTDFELRHAFDFTRPELRAASGGHGGDDLDERPLGDPHEGHYHVYMDQTLVNPLLMDDPLEVALTIPLDTSPGAHALIIRLHHVDHRPILPEAVDQASITVR